MIGSSTLDEIDLRRLPAEGKVVDSLGQWASLQDPDAAQRALCEAVLATSGRGVADGSRLAMLVALDRPARLACERLLVRFAEGDARQRLLGSQSYLSAARLCDTMTAAFSDLLRHFGESPATVPVESAPDVIVRLLAFRQIELLLRMFRYKGRSASQWRAVHQAYGVALERGVHDRAVTTSPSDLLPATSTSVERQYIQVLLLGAVNAGQLPPREALWACCWFGRWSQSLSLTRGEGRIAGGAPHGFCVHLDSADGPTRNPAANDERLLHLDTAPLLPLIADEVESLRIPGAVRSELAESTRHARLALLGKLGVLLAPVPTLIERRGQREPASSTVQVVAGLAHIVQALRNAARRSSDARPAASALREPTIGAFSGSTRTMTLAAGLAQDPTPEVWQARDRSDSGCRMRGRTARLNRVIPGSLLALRTSESAPWSLGVVRRLRRLMVDHVEIGVEYIGRNPRFVKVVVDEDFDPSTVRSGDADPRCVGALYLPPSDALPSMPIRTLVLPQREFRLDGRVTLLAADAIYTLRLEEPIQRQLEFVVAPFAVIRKSAGAVPAHLDSRLPR